MPKKLPEALQKDSREVLIRQKRYADGSVRNDIHISEQRETVIKGGSSSSTPGQRSIQNRTKEKSGGNHS